MALDSDLAKMLTIRWKIDKPFKDRRRVSSDFSLMETTWYLTMEYDADMNIYCPEKGRYVRSDYYAITLIGRENEKPKVPFSVTTYIGLDESENGIPTLGSKTTVKSRKEIIWQEEVAKTSSGIPDLKHCAKLNVVCLFNEVAPSMCRLKNETEHLSTQTDDLGESSTTLYQESCCEPENNLSSDFSNLLDQKRFADLKLQCGERSFSAHRSILAARSEVLAEKFSGVLVDREPESVDLSDVDSEVLDLLLRFVYSGNIPHLTDECAPRLYAAGRSFAVRGLRKACSEWMARNLSQENCIAFFTVAEEHGDGALKSSVVSFIVGNPQVLKTEDWYRFSENHPKLAIEVLTNFVPNVAVKNNHSD